MKQDIKNIKISDLNLWTENPRDPIEVTKTDEEIIDRIIEDSNDRWEIEKLVKKMGEYYDFSELPIVVKTDGKYIVYDGNKRVALLKILQDDKKYKKYVGKLFREEEPKLLREQISLPCVICDKETAIKSIKRKHFDTGSWKELERDYFSLNFENTPKNTFIALNDQTGLIKNNKILNQRFVKEEVLNEKNLKELGISFKDEKLESKYSDEQLNTIFNAVQTSLQEKEISTRNNRGELKSVIEKNPEVQKILNNPSKKEFENISLTPTMKEKTPRRTQSTKKSDILFGKVLELEKGIVNDLYLAIDKIYKKEKDDENVLLIIGMSLRLILDVAAKVWLNKENCTKYATNDSVYDILIKDFKEISDKKQKTINYLSTTNDFLNKRFNLEALLAKYAHGNIQVSKQDVLNMSYVTADILENYFKKQKIR